MNATLLRHTLSAQFARLIIIAVALAGWGALMPVIYVNYGAQFRQLLDSGLIPRQFADFGGGDIFSLPGSIALRFIHPISVALNAVFAVGFAAAAVAGERQRGTLEVLLARPLSRRVVALTLYVCVLAFVAVTMAALLGGAWITVTLTGSTGELDVGRLPVLWLNGVLLFGALGAIGLAASVSFDRLTPALGIGLGVAIVSYFLEILGSLWPDAKGLQPLSLFHYLQARDVLTGNVDPFSFVLLAGVGALALAVALVVFPRRDLAAPS